MELPRLSVAFLAGVATILTPCCLPLLPPLLAGSAGHRFRPLAIVTGSLSSFTTIGVLTGALGGFSPDALRTPAFLIIVAFGAVMVDDDLHHRYSEVASRLAGRAATTAAIFDEDRRPIVSGFILGTLLGFIWLPCVGPVLGAVLAYAMTAGGPAESGFLLFVYGLGFAVPLVGVAYGGRFAARSVVERIGLREHGAAVRRAVGLLLLASGVGLLFDLDRVFLSLVA